MTLNEGIEKVYKLLDEYGTGGGIDEDLEVKMPDFFDTAQKQIAQIQPVTDTERIERLAGVTEYDMPKSFRKLRRIWADGEIRTKRFRWKAGKLIIPPEESAEIEIEFYKTPETIDKNTPGTYEFEVSEEACQAMPFFVAAQVLSGDLVQDSGIYLSMWQVMIGNLTQTPEGGSAVRQTFYRGR